MSSNIEEKLKEIKEADRDKPRKKITVLGAGMAGLVAAYELKKLGHDVTIFEASDRVGGRAWTHKFEDGQYHEFGAMRFPESHNYTRYYATKVCDLEFRKFVNHHEDEDGMYWIKNKLSFHSDYDIKLLPELNLTEEELDTINNGPIPPQVKHMQLLNLFVKPLVKLVNEIESSKEDKAALFAEGSMTPKIEYLEKVSLGDFVKSNLTSTDAVDLVGAITGLEVWWDRAITMFLRDEITKTGDGLEEIVGGTSELPNKIHELLKDLGCKVRFKSPIKSINNKRNGVQLVVHNAIRKKDEIIDCDYVVCTIPFGVLRRINLVGLSDNKMRAIRNLSYASSTKVLVNCKNRFWETSDNPIVGGGSQTDLINRSIYYQSDNFKNTNKNKTESNCHGLYTSYSEKNKKDIKSTEVSKGPGVIVGSYNWGIDARRLGQLPKEERKNVVVEALFNIHPEIKDKGMVKDGASMFWDENPWAGGAFCFMRPGDFIDYYESTIKPEGNLFFSGEHCSLDQGWIQGALISAINTIDAIVKKSR